MCGIIGMFQKEGQEDPREWVVDQYQEQHTRGKEGFGIVKINKDGEYEVKRSTEGAKFMFDLHQTPVQSMLVHHRMPTSSPNYLGQTHPIMVENGSLNHKYLVVHNGVINNEEELKKKHEDELGFQYTTAIQVKSAYNTSWQDKFNDSESLAIEVARFIENQTDEIGATGSAAFIALQIERETDKVLAVFFGRNYANPLHMAFTRGVLKLSSEGIGEDIKPDTLYSWDFENTKLKKRKLHFATAPLPKHTVGFYPKTSSTPVYNSVKEKYSNWSDDEARYAHNHSNDELMKDIPWDKGLDEDEQLEMIIDEGLSEIELFLEEFRTQLYTKDTSEDIDTKGLTDVLKGILDDTVNNVHEFHLDKEKENQQELALTY